MKYTGVFLSLALAQILFAVPAVAFSFGTKPEEVYRELAAMLNPEGIPYGDVSAEIDP